MHTLKRSDDDEGGGGGGGFGGSGGGGEQDGVSNGMGGVSPAFVARSVFPPRDPTQTWIYHERQESLLCGQHCLNNLVQRNGAFSAVGLADIAHALDREEQRLYLDASTTDADKAKYLGEASGNVDESGNFSLEVLRRALMQSHGIELVSWTGETGKAMDPMAESGSGFVVNRSSHWFTIRRIGGSWWNLNSTLGRPEHISDFFLAAFLADLTQSRWLVFIPRGRLPPCGSMPASHEDPTPWYTERELLLPPPSAAAAAAAAAPAPFAGKGNRLDNGGSEAAAAAAAHEAEVQLIAESDPELALALALSRQEAEAAATKPLGKDAMREKRLAALAARGL